MKLILITTETPFGGESAMLNRLFEAGLERLHLRKPSATQCELATLLEQIDSRFYSRIVLHDHFGLLPRLGLGGIHLNRRNPIVPPAISTTPNAVAYAGNETAIPKALASPPTTTVSRSCHCISELATDQSCDYLFLSPIFDSVSKSGYGSAFTPEQLLDAHARGLIDRRVFALGGVTPATAPLAARYGFGGVAVLGTVWGETPEPDAVLKRFAELQTIVSRL